MMQEHFYVLNVFTVQSQWWSGNTPLLVEFEDLPYPGEGPIPPIFASKMTAKDAWTAIKNHFV